MTTKITEDNIEQAALDLFTSGGGGSSSRITSVVVANSSYTDLDDTAVNTSGGYINVYGAGFVSGCTVLVGDTTASSVAFVSSSQLRVQLQAFTAGVYPIYVVNPDGTTAVRPAAVAFSATPVWVTGATLPTGIKSSSYSQQLSATGATSYSIAAGSSLPSGLSLSSGGLLSGTAPNVELSTTYNFTINATDGELQDTPQAFSLTITGAEAPATVEYLVVAGGGGGAGGRGGGGGAGGYRTATGFAVTAGSPITVTVGAGGAGGGSGGSEGSKGSNSVFGSITATGGGQGSRTGSGGSGGSGGGGGSDASGSGGSGNTPSTSPSQGNNGAAGLNAANNYPSGGGGGAGAAATIASNGNQVSNGGVGAQSSITGIATYYAGGGGGGNYSGGAAIGGAGGQGGGGQGGAGFNSTAGTANTGGGGGGSNDGTDGRAGGSGVVIIRYPDTALAATSTTGSPEVTVSGGYRVYKWTSSGSVTF